MIQLLNGYRHDWPTLVVESKLVLHFLVAGNAGIIARNLPIASFYFYDDALQRCMPWGQWRASRSVINPRKPIDSNTKTGPSLETHSLTLLRTSIVP